MEKILLLCMLCCSFLMTRAQESTTILTQDQNDKWLENLSSEKKLTSKLGLISNRILTDTLVFYSPLLSGYVDSRTKNKYTKTTKIKPLYVFVNETENILLNLNLEGKKALRLTKILNETNIKNIKIAETEAALIYGTTGYQGGVIFFEVKNDVVFNLIKDYR